MQENNWAADKLQQQQLARRRAKRAIGRFAHRVKGLSNGPEPELVPFLMGARVGSKLEL